MKIDIYIYDRATQTDTLTHQAADLRDFLDLENPPYGHYYYRPHDTGRYN